jgi:hypothetical protein
MTMAWVAVSAALILGGCSKHQAQAVASCRAVAAKSKTVAVSSRGAIGLEKVGLTPDELKALESC